MDGDGVREITTLGTINNPETSADVTVLSIYASTTGQPIMSFYGTGSDVLMSVFEGRATGNLVDELLLQIGEETEVTPGFVLDRLPALDLASRHRNGIARTYEWEHFETTRYVLRLIDPNPGFWLLNIDNFKKVTDIATRKSTEKYPNKDDDNKRNALRHALWQFMLTCLFGEGAARDIGNIHEDYSKDPCDTAIDQFNNNAARRKATPEACANSPIEQLCDDMMQAIEDGEFVISPDDPRLNGACQS
ncbi:MAG: hypothetical protein IT432_17070 [Phycisphaerales bacterium]|nr:hypothetical protein [Phycisphaerales bacterium]